MQAIHVNIKNQDGSKGPICNYCGGWGFTNMATGGSKGCHQCNCTGVQAPDLHEMNLRITTLESKIDQILEILK